MNDAPEPPRPWRVAMGQQATLARIALVPVA